MTLKDKIEKNEMQKSLNKIDQIARELDFWSRLAWDNGKIKQSVFLSGLSHILMDAQTDTTKDELLSRLAKQIEGSI